jgi:predicted aldo/keto reductase-like oxidoreductase
MSASQKESQRKEMAMKVAKPLAKGDLSSRVSEMRAKIVEMMLKNMTRIENTA